LAFAHEGTYRARKALLRSVKELPEHVPVDELIDHILLLSKLERGLEQSAVSGGEGPAGNSCGASVSGYPAC